MRSAFPGFPAEGLAFFASLQRNNRREWFQPRKAIFEEKLKQPMREFVGALNSAMTDVSRRSMRPIPRRRFTASIATHASARTRRRTRPTSEHCSCGVATRRARDFMSRFRTNRWRSQEASTRRRRKPCSPYASIWPNAIGSSARSPEPERFANSSRSDAGRAVDAGTQGLPQRSSCCRPLAVQTTPVLCRVTARSGDDACALHRV